MLKHDRKISNQFLPLYYATSCISKHRSPWQSQIHLSTKEKEQRQVLDEPGGCKTPQCGSGESGRYPKHLWKTSNTKHVLQTRPTHFIWPCFRDHDFVPLFPLFLNSLNWVFLMILFYLLYCLISCASLGFVLLFFSSCFTIYNMYLLIYHGSLHRIVSHFICILRVLQAYTPISPSSLCATTVIHILFFSWLEIIIYWYYFLLKQPITF